MKKFLFLFLFILLSPLLALADGRAVQVESLLAGLTDSSGEPLAGGLIYTYESGTSTAKSVYTDQAKTTAATNPVELDAQGRTRVFAEGAYKFIVKTAAGSTLYTWDNLQYIYPASSALYAGTSTGSSSVYAVTPSPALTAYTDGLTIAFVANHANTGATTLNVSSLGAKAVKRIDGTTALSASDITSGMLVNVQYVTSSDHFRILNTAGTLPVGSGGTGATAAPAARANLGLGSGSAPTNGQTLIGDGSSFATAALTGTANQVTVTNGSGTITLSLPQSIATGSSPTFASPQFTGLNISGLTAFRGVATDGSKNLTTAPGRQAYAPTATGSGSMTISAQTNYDGEYWIDGPFVHFRISAVMTLGGTASTEIRFPGLPAGVADSVNSTWSCAAAEGATAVADPRWNYDGTNLRVIKPGGASWTLGVVTVHVQGMYRAI